MPKGQGRPSTPKEKQAVSHLKAIRGRDDMKGTTRENNAIKTVVDRAIKEQARARGAKGDHGIAQRIRKNVGTRKPTVWSGRDVKRPPSGFE